MITTVINLAKIMPKVVVRNAFGISRSSWDRHSGKIPAAPSGEPNKPKNSGTAAPWGAAKKRAYSPEYRQMVIDTVNLPENRDKSVREIFAQYLDAGIYLASISTIYRFLAAIGQTTERRLQRKHPNYVKPVLVATAPNQVWTWDITKLKLANKRGYLNLYVVLDLFSRYVVGWLLADKESAQIAEALMTESIIRMNITGAGLAIHSDRGSSMKKLSLKQKMKDLGIRFSFSRPRVSDDNPFSESAFKTVKHHPCFPGVFEDMNHGLNICREFFHWYNNEHHHVGIGLLTPHMVHFGCADSIISARNDCMKQAYTENPERFVSGPPQKQMLHSEVWINEPNTKTGEISRFGLL